VRLPVAALALTLVLAGCAGGPRDGPSGPGGFDQQLDVEGASRHELRIPSFDGTQVAAVVHVPQAGGAGATDARWPTVVFLHGWGGSKAAWEGQTVPGQPVAQAAPGTNVLADYARAGFLAVAYDARGFGDSGGQAGVAGPEEVQDLQAVIRHVESRFPTTGMTGVAGVSYGAGQALLALVHVPEVETAVASYGWSDLYEGLLPGDVPKAEWAQGLYLMGVTGSQGDVQPFVHEWYAQLYTRSDLASVREAMAKRSAGEALARTAQPLLVCQGMQESLFPQAHRMQDRAGPTRTIISHGGHGSGDCPEARLAWFQHHLQGYDTGVDAWPELRTQDAAGAHSVDYARWPTAAAQTFYLRAPDLAAEPSPATFRVRQTVPTPVSEPSVLWDRVGQPYPAIPPALREDPAGVLFALPPLQAAGTLLGTPRVLLEHDAGDAPYQVAASLYLERDGRSQLVSRGAAADLHGATLADGALLEVELTWTKLALQPGDRLVLKVASNDPAVFMPLLQPYDVTFTGASRLELPMLAP